MILERTFYQRDSCEVARALLGQRIVRRIPERKLVGKIVETEAYYGTEDPASHAYQGKTDRSAIMWKEPGLVYVYLIYGTHFMFNVVTENQGDPGAVLIRAIEPLRGLNTMKDSRGIQSSTKLGAGPGMLTEALKITKELNGNDLTEKKDIWLEKAKPVPTGQVQNSPRIGVTNQGSTKNYRFFIDNNSFVSQ